MGSLGDQSPIVQHEEGALPVTDGAGRLVGSVQASSVVNAMAQEAAEASEARESGTSALELEQASLRTSKQQETPEEDSVAAR